MGYRDKKKKDRCPYCSSHKGTYIAEYRSRWHDNEGVWWVDIQKALVCKNKIECGQVIDDISITIERE